MEEEEEERRIHAFLRGISAKWMQIVSICLNTDRSYLHSFCSPIPFTVLITITP